MPHGSAHLGDTQAGRKWLVVRALEREPCGQGCHGRAPAAALLVLREAGVDAYALAQGDTTGEPVAHTLGEDHVWPNPRRSVVVVFNGTDHFNGVCQGGGQKKPEEEQGMGLGRTCEQLEQWLEYWGVDLWPSTGRGFCAFESLGVSAALAKRKL